MQPARRLCIAHSVEHYLQALISNCLRDSYRALNKTKLNKSLKNYKQDNTAKYLYWPSCWEESASHWRRGPWTVSTHSSQCRDLRRRPTWWTTRARCWCGWGWGPSAGADRRPWWPYTAPRNPPTCRKSGRWSRSQRCRSQNPSSGTCRSAIARCSRRRLIWCKGCSR